MIVPRSIVAWLLFLLPLAAAAPLSPALSALFTACAGVVVLLSAIDIALALQAARDVRIELPAVTRLAMQRPGIIACRVHNSAEAAFTMSVVTVFPAALNADWCERLLAVPAAACAAFSHVCTPTRRGAFRIGPCHAEVVAPLGLWAVRKTFTAPAAVHVYPDLQRGRRNVAALFSKRFAPGSHLQRTPGQGREFDKLRDYVPGDSRDIISWKTTAKRARPISKVYQIERTQEVYAVIDASRLSSRKAGGEPVIEHYLGAALSLGLAVQQQADLFGLLTFDDQVRAFIRAGGGKAHYASCRNAVYALQPEEKYPDFASLFSFIRLQLRRRALLVFLTNLDDQGIADPFIEHIGLISRQHLCIVVMTRTRDMSPLFTMPAASTEDIASRLAAHVRWAEFLSVQARLAKLGVQASTAAHDSLALDLITQYVAVKRRQLL